MVELVLFSSANVITRNSLLILFIQSTRERLIDLFIFTSTAVQQLLTRHGLNGLLQVFTRFNHYLYCTELAVNCHKEYKEAFQK